MSGSIEFVDLRQVLFDEVPHPLRDIYRRMVKPYESVKYGNPLPDNASECDICRWRELCAKGAQFKMPVACEDWDDRDKMRLGKSAYHSQMMELLEERMTF